MWLYARVYVRVYARVYARVCACMRVCIHKKYVRWCLVHARACVGVYMRVCTGV